VPGAAAAKAAAAEDCMSLAELTLEQLAEAIRTIAQLPEEWQQVLEKVFDGEMEPEAHDRLMKLPIVVELKALFKNVVLRCDGLAALDADTQLRELPAIMENVMTELVQLMEQHFAKVARALIAGKSVEELLPAGCSEAEGVSDLLLYSVLVLRTIEENCTRVGFAKCRSDVEQSDGRTQALTRAAQQMWRNMKLKRGRALNMLMCLLEQLLVIIAAVQTGASPAIKTAITSHVQNNIEGMAGMVFETRLPMENCAFVVQPKKGNRRSAVLPL